MPDTILVVEDEATVARGLEYGLKAEGFAVVVAPNGKKALEAARSAHPRLVLLDVRLPDMSGFDVCRSLREEGMTLPIIMVTARDEEVDKVLGLELGADDYVVKPFDPKELLARVRAVLRRVRLPEEKAPLTVGDLVVDPARHEVRRGDRRIDLTATEFAILHVLARHPGTVYTRLQLLESVQGEAYAGYERAIDSHIKNLRQKLEPDPRKPRYVVTIHGVGYRLEAGDAA